MRRSEPDVGQGQVHPHSIIIWRMNVPGEKISFKAVLGNMTALRSFPEDRNKKTIKTKRKGFY